MTNRNACAKTNNSVNLKGPKPECMILERNLSFKSLVQHNQSKPSPKSFTRQNDGAKTKKCVKLTGPKPASLILDRNLSFRNLVPDNREDQSPKCLKRDKNGITEKLTRLSLPEPAVFLSPKPVDELDAAALKLQKVYKSYRTRRNLADCAVVVEELWWKALDFAALKRSSVSFFNDEKPETAISKWARARTRAAKVGKGLSKDDKAQKLALQHWLEAIDPRHRYGHNLHLYYDIWSESESTQPFFFWLDIGDGREVNLEKCARTVLQRQCITYLGPKEREAFEVVIENGKLIYRESRVNVETVEGSKWIFVLSTTRTLYVGQKKKGSFQHSSFLAGAAITAAGRLVAHGGVIEAIWPYSGHYLPTEENFRELISFLEENHVDLTDVQTCAIDDDAPSSKSLEEEPSAISRLGPHEPIKSDGQDSFEMACPSKRFSCKWVTGAGPRIGCVRDYPMELQTRALEQANLSPRIGSAAIGSCGPIPSLRPSPNLRLSPHLAHMGLPSPKS